MLAAQPCVQVIAQGSYDYRHADEYSLSKHIMIESLQLKREPVVAGNLLEGKAILYVSILDVGNDPK